jgi:translation initiation factor 6
MVDNVLGHSMVGVHIAFAGDILFTPIGMPDDELERVTSLFDCEVANISIGGSSLIGSLLAGTKRGIAVADLATEKEIDILTSFGDVVVMESGVNAAGNLLECNERGAIVSPVIPTKGLDLIADVLGVVASHATVAGMETVGSLVVANNAGALVHPDITTEEVEIIEATLGVPVMVGTVCFGTPEVGSGCEASEKHALVGSKTTGPELNRIEDALGLF